MAKNAADVLASPVYRNAREAQIEEITRVHGRMRPGWYASSGLLGITMGPLKSRSEAEESMRLTARARAVQKLEHGTDYPFPVDLRVWKEKK